MRSPGAAFDLRAALTQELSAAIEEIDTPIPRPAAVHRCRVRLKRARALARVGKSGAPGLSAVFNDSARAVMLSLAPTRELTALADAARAAAREQRNKKDARALTAVAEALEAERAALPRLDVEAARAGIRDLMALAQVWPEASARQIRKGAKRVARKARAAFGEGRGEDRPALRHEWRKREKDRFFAVSLLDSAWPEKRRRHRGERVGDLLGKERDAMLLSKRIASTPGLAGTLKAAKRAQSALGARADRLGKRADRLGKRLHGDRA
jgi:hypothetical protein